MIEIKCPVCSGEKYVTSAADTPVLCQKCQGRGRITISEKEICPGCHGDGKNSTHYICQQCNGTGIK